MVGISSESGIVERLAAEVGLWGGSWPAKYLELPLGLPTHLLLVFILNPSQRGKEGKMRNFLWEGGGEHKKDHLVRWNLFQDCRNRESELLEKFQSITDREVISEITIEEGVMCL